MTAREVTLAAMFLFAKDRALETGDRELVEREWKAWARVVHESYRARVRQTLRAIKWAKKPLTGAELAAKHGFEPIPDWKRDPVARPMQSAASGDASKEET